MYSAGHHAQVGASVSIIKPKPKLFRGCSDNVEYLICLMLLNLRKAIVESNFVISQWIFLYLVLLVICAQQFIIDIEGHFISGACMVLVLYGDALWCDRYHILPNKNTCSHIFCLFDLILYVQSTIFQLLRDGSSLVEPVPARINVLVQGHNTVTPVRLEPVAHRSLVKHSTTESLHSHMYMLYKQRGLTIRALDFQSIQWRNLLQARTFALYIYTL